MKLVFLLSWLAISSAASIPGRRNSKPVVNGHGVNYVGIENTQYDVYEWRGIRYANPPTGSLRLQPPVPVDNKGTVQAQNFGSTCFGLGTNHTGQAEDCLFLNVYKPSLCHDKHHKKLPVMVWIHGGGFNKGAGSIYQAESLVQTSHNLQTPTIVVTINYRLSFFGFSGISITRANTSVEIL
jgi:carboxylesterase type B